MGQTGVVPTPRRRVKPFRCGYECDCLIDPLNPAPLDTCSYGGGHQSTALMVLAVRGVIPTRTFLFCNVGDDSEHPGTLEYVREVAQPYADHHGIDLQTLVRRRRDGTEETLWGRLMQEGSRSLPIPVRMSNGAPGNRSCTADFKIRVVSRWLKRHGARAPKRCATHHAEDELVTWTKYEGGDLNKPVQVTGGWDGGARPDCAACDQGHIAQVSIGISQDEALRANGRTRDPWETPVYPLISQGIDTGLRMRRDDCDQLVASEPLPPGVAIQIKQAVADGRLTVPSVVRQLERSGYATLPIPPKSSCFFCPFHKPSAWSDLERETPELFDRSVLLEDTLNARRSMLGKDPVFLTRFAIPLRDAIDTDQPLLPGMDDDAACDSGYCWT